MKLAASQFAWTPEDEPAALDLLRGCGFAGVEIAPTRALGPQPYEKPAEAAVFAAGLQEEYGLVVCSLQSLWYGQAGSLFGVEQAYLLDYTKAAVRFAEAVGAKNLVFGSPKNRNRPEGMGDERAVAFFRQVGEYAAARGCVLALEANPPVYGTNFMNTTAEALEVARRADSPGCMVNLDFGTIVTNGENVQMLADKVKEIHHVHISEPELAAIRPRPEHRELAALLRREGYGGWVSIETGAHGLDALREAAGYVAEVFG